MSPRSSSVQGQRDDPAVSRIDGAVLRALKELGGSATVKDIYERVVEDEKFSEDQQSISTKDGRMSEIEYRLHWARSHLKAIGTISNSARGVWAHPYAVLV